MKICIVGEGPVGLLTSLLFIYFKNKYSLEELEIFLYKNRPSFERRHIINITKNIMEEIEKLIMNCHHCLLHNLSSQEIDQIKISINCLETILYKKLDKTNITIFENVKFDIDEQYINKYDHVFLCDGYQSTNRRVFIYDNKNYTPIKYVMYNEFILVLYANLNATTADISESCIEKLYQKIIFSEDKIHESGLDFNMLIAFISLIYNIKDRYNSFPNSNPKLKKNIWSSGFDNYNDFLDIFQETITFITNIESEIIINTLSKFNVNITDNMRFLLTNKSHEMEKIFELYKIFLYNELKKVNGTDNPFMIHSVIPNCSSHGIILDEEADNLLFAKKSDEGKYYWLLGDSANGYPPGYSLMIGLKSVFFLINNFFKINFGIETETFSQISIPISEFSCSTENKISVELSFLDTCSKLSESFFIDGYLQNKAENNSTKKSILDVLSIINHKNCLDRTSPNDYLLNYYNMYQLNDFFTNLNHILCSQTFGGKKKIKRKKHKKTKKEKKSRKKRKITRRNKIRKYFWNQKNVKI
jgi:hypothetical protein